jgi:pSer/pThr/pTyr-binding forkhead associated (FHA) protein/V8-like Glu-specific endopeptidase
LHELFSQFHLFKRGGIKLKKEISKFYKEISFTLIRVVTVIKEKTLYGKFSTNMKTLKIGRSSTNNIVISDVTVSAQHAIITILDTKEVHIKDLNSTNGTYVNGKRINTETNITANDVIKVGNATLDWLKYLNERKQPAPPVFSGDVSTIKQKKTIGSLSSNDIVLNHSDVSRNHAQLIEKVNGDIVIADSGSTNGTYINGQKVSIQVLRAGDRVLIANKYLLDWESIFGKRPTPKPKNLKTILISAAAVAAAVVGIFFLIKPDPNPVLTPEEIYAKYEKSVVMISVNAPYRVSIQGYGTATIDAGGSGTGFFVSKDGKIVTNRHVVSPTPKEAIQQSIAQELGVKPNSVKVESLGYSISVAVNGTHADFKPCAILEISEKEEIDIAVIQMKSHTLPDGVKNIVDLDKAVVNDEKIVLGTPIYTIGFPAGLKVGSTPQGIQANNQRGEISQLRGKYEFEHNAKIAGGASGSPIFDKYGDLIGIVYAAFKPEIAGNVDYNLAIKAKYAVELAK